MSLAARLSSLCLLLLFVALSVATSAAPQRAEDSIDTTPVTSGAIAVGMSKAEVEEILGRAERVTALEGVETWSYYEYSTMNVLLAEATIGFREGLVVSFNRRDLVQERQNNSYNARSSRSQGAVCRTGSDGIRVCSPYSGAECRIGSDGHAACGFDCRMSSHGYVVCARERDQHCRMGSDGHVACGYDCRIGFDGRATCDRDRYEGGR